MTTDRVNAPVTIQRTVITAPVYPAEKVPAATEAEALAGTVTQVRVWSPLRIWQAVRQAVLDVFSGVDGGNTLVGGTGPGEELHLVSTAHETKGKIRLGDNVIVGPADISADQEDLCWLRVQGVLPPGRIGTNPWGVSIAAETTDPMNPDTNGEQSVLVVQSLPGGTARRVGYTAIVSDCTTSGRGRMVALPAYGGVRGNFAGYFQAIGPTDEGHNVAMFARCRDGAVNIPFVAVATKLDDRINGGMLAAGNTDTGTRFGLYALLGSELPRFDQSAALLADNGPTDGDMQRWLDNGDLVASMQSGGRLAIGSQAATARLHLPPGQATAGCAPQKYTEGPLLNTPEPGAVEYDKRAQYLTLGGETRLSRTWTGHFESNSGGMAGYSVRIRIPADQLEFAGSAVRVALQAGSLIPLTVGRCYIGHVADSGDDWDFDGQQRPVLFGGETGVTIPSGLAVTSDWVDFTLDPNRDLIVAWYCDGIVNQSDSGAKSLSATGVITYTVEGDSVALTTPPDHTVSLNRNDAVALVDVRTGSEGQTVRRQYVLGWGGKASVTSAGTVLASLAMPAGSRVSGVIEWTASATDNTDHQSASGSFRFSALNTGSEILVDFRVRDDVSMVLSGGSTLEITPSAAGSLASAELTVSLTAVSSLTSLVEVLWVLLPSEGVTIL